MNRALPSMELSESLANLRRSLILEVAELSVLVRGTQPPADEVRVVIHRSVHRLAGGLGFFGLRDEGEIARVIDVSLSTDTEKWPIDELLDLLRSIERLLLP